MKATQRISRQRRDYNIWVRNETLEDYALRFTANRARRWTIAQVGQTALGATAFLALEAIAAAITLKYGFVNAIAAMFAVAAVSFVIGFPIAYNAARHGLDIDLLTRGAGFGYLGSTLTSLIYASFTFIFFAIEAAILASALNVLTGLPLSWGYFLCSIAVIPIVTHGISTISRFQIGTQPIWLILQFLALFVLIANEFDRIGDWTAFTPAESGAGGELNLLMFGAAASVMFALVAQIGEQVDYLRFMPEKNATNYRSWWFWLILAGPGWILIGLTKMLLGSFIAFLSFTDGIDPQQAADPVHMYEVAFLHLTSSPSAALILAGIMVLISQMKINVTNAYAGSIAWSNFFSRLTHNHPGRVVWLVFNVIIALILMELGIYKVLEGILGAFSIIALSWLASLAAELMINKPLGISPRTVEFKRAHLYDVNPVGFFSLVISAAVGLSSYLGAWGVFAQSLAHFICVACCFVCMPLLGVLTRGKYYLARQSPELHALQRKSDEADHQDAQTCCICSASFELEDMSFCPAYDGPICSLCCSLDARCMDRCKPQSRIHDQLERLVRPMLPKVAFKALSSWAARYLLILTAFSLTVLAIVGLVFLQASPQTEAEATLLRQALLTVFAILVIIAGVTAWLFLLTAESRRMAHLETSQQTARLMNEIQAHKQTDEALQRAKEAAEQANQAKTRFLTGISHELRTPLQSMLGYAQLLDQRNDIPPQHRRPLQVIKRSGDYLANLVEGLLDVSKIEAGHLEIYRNEVNLTEMIDQLVAMFEEHARASKVRFECQVHDKLPELVVTDEKRLRQILINLLSNAFKYTKKGLVRLDVRYRNQVAVFSVTDTGVGIQPNDLQRILHPFERIRNASVPNVSGSGLGLTIVQLLSEIMGGELSIQSTPGKGSQFKVSLMLPWVSRQHQFSLPDKEIIGYQGDARSIMIVDDEPLHRGLLADLLMPIGFSIAEAYDAENCLELIADGIPDLFLLDVSLPGMSGLELAHELRRRNLRVPIIMISADATERHRNDHWRRADHDAYLVKPVNNKKLLETIREQLDLEWTYREDADVRAPLTLNSNVSAPAEPSHSDLSDDRALRELIAFAHIGYQSGVYSKLEDIVGSGVLDAEEAAVLRELADQMRFAEIAATLEDRIKESVSHE